MAEQNFILLHDQDSAAEVIYISQRLHVLAY
jgi:hypothetical protein